MATGCSGKLWFRLLLVVLVLPAGVKAQEKGFTHADTLRGSITPERAWWDVLRYDITVTPDYVQKTTTGRSHILFKVVQKKHVPVMQIDLQEPLLIDSILLNQQQSLTFSREGNAWHVQVPGKIKKVNALDIYYHGVPHEAIRAPWDGGWTFTKDSLGRPWMTVTCQGLGASIWYPCKDHQSDEPDQGASLTMIVPDTLVAVANGRLQYKKDTLGNKTVYQWAVVNPINNYDLIPYIGKYVNFKETFAGEKGTLDLNYWVLDYNLGKAKGYMPNEVHRMLKAFEYWMGPYAFYEDGYKLVEVPHTGMEHQSAVAYGNWYAPGYRGRDLSGTGLGLKWDFIIVHESGHEWFGNNITSKDLADMWIHEGFTNYSETLYVDYTFGADAGNAYNVGIRRGIRNDSPVIPAYNVNAQGSGDMYPKIGNMLQAIRHSIGDDNVFRGILRGLNKTFYHQTVSAADIENYVCKKAGFDYKPVFTQYLTTTQIPSFEFYVDANQQVHYRYTDCIASFNLPLYLHNETASLKLFPETQWKTTSLKAGQAALMDTAGISKMYYIMPRMVAAQ